MGQEPSLNAFGKLIALSIVFTVPALYMLPSYEAWKQKHQNLQAILLLNLFLGWTLVGWVISAVWAFKQAEAPKIISEDQSQSYNYSANSTASSSEKAMKLCPFCAEDILAAAIKCKHCGSPIES